MKTLQLQTQIEKWEQTSVNFTGHILDGEKQTFLLFPHHPEFKSLFQVGANIYITDPNTDFILDILIKTVIQFDIDGEMPTLQDLYASYVAAREDWRMVVLRESLKHGVTIERKGPPASFDELKGYLQTVLNNTYKPN
jgi:hypothetical protein